MAQETNDGRAPSGQALVDDAPAGHRPAGFDPSREAAMISIIRDTLWMACRYAHGRNSYAVWMYNAAARRAIELGVVEKGFETFAISGDLSPEMSGLSQQEFSTAMHCWSSPQAIRTHVPYRDSDRSGEASETRSGSTVGESAGPQDIAQPDQAK